MSERKKVRDLLPGDVVDLSGVPGLNDGDAMFADYEYVVVDSIGNGWADSMAFAGEVVLYSAESLSEPLLIDGDTLVTWIQNDEESLLDIEMNEKGQGI